MKDYQKEAADLFLKLIETRRNILQAAESLPIEQQRQVFLGSWSARELLAHLAGWDITNLEAAQSVMDGKLPGFYEYVDKDWQTYNAVLVERYGRETFVDQILLAQQTHQQLMDYLAALPAVELWKDRGVRARGWKVTIGRLLEAELGDEEVHLHQIREFARKISTGA